MNLQSDGFTLGDILSFSYWSPTSTKYGRTRVVRIMEWKRNSFIGQEPCGTRLFKYKYMRDVLFEGNLKTKLLSKEEVLSMIGATLAKLDCEQLGELAESLNLIEGWATVGDTLIYG